MRMRAALTCRAVIFGCLFFLSNQWQVSHAMPWDAAPMGPPVPGMPVSSFEKPLAAVEALVIERGRLRIVGRSDARLVIKNRFVLTHPTRLILDIADAKLNDNIGLPFPPGEIGGVVVNTIRVGQFTADTVRVVIETDQPERFQVMTEGRTVSVAAIRENGLIGGLYQSVFRRNEPARVMPPPVAANASAPAPVSAPIAASYPQLGNLRKLQAQSNGNGFMPVAPSSRRNHIIEIARSQIGLSKDTDPDYVIQTFSQGKDNSWCADFVSTILDWAGGSPWGHLSRVQDIYDWGLANRQILSQPEPASLVVFSNDGKNLNHIAFVESVNADNTITTIGGNEGYAARAYKTTGSVNRSIYKLEDKKIVAFIDPVLSTQVSSNVERGPYSPVRF